MSKAPACKNGKAKGDKACRVPTEALPLRLESVSGRAAAKAGHQPGMRRKSWTVVGTEFGHLGSPLLGTGCIGHKQIILERR